jgi:predicted small secreted protein
VAARIWYRRQWRLQLVSPAILSTCADFVKSAGVTEMTRTLFVLFALVLAGCNTVQGIGKDVKKAGEAVENAAKK